MDEISILKNKFIFFIKLTISSKKNTTTAIKEPMCKQTSVTRLWFWKPNNFENIIRCEDELMGKNSVIPWIIDKINISITVKN